MSRGTQRHLLWRNAVQQRFFKTPETAFNYFTYAKRVDKALSALSSFATLHLAHPTMLAKQWLSVIHCAVLVFLVLLILLVILD